MKLSNTFILPLLLFIFVFYSCNNEPTINITPLTNFWDKAVPFQEIPKNLSSLSAKECGFCHVEHYKEWQKSTHSQAWTDLQFQAELNKESSPRMCINCHIPLENQQEEFVSGYEDGDIYKPVTKPNPHFDYELQQEGITCAACHVRHNAIIGPTGTDKAPHKTIKDTLHLSEQLCIDCHNAVAVITPTLACTFETADEWKAGPYPGQGKNCKTCHMPETHRAIVPGFEKRLSHFHSFPGSGIPKSESHHPEMLHGLDYTILPSKTYSRNDSAIVSIKLANNNAGHRVPTGDPERFILTTFYLLQDDQPIDTLAYRIGEKWEWHPKAKKLDDNNLNPLEERILYYNFKVPQKGEIKVKIQITKHRSIEENIIYNKIDPSYPIQILDFEKIVPVKIK